MNTNTQPETTTPRFTVEDLQGLIWATLTELDETLPLVAELLDTRQRGIGFLTVEAAMVQNEQSRAERRDRLKNTKLGVTVTGDVSSPAAIGPLAVIAEAEDVLSDIARHIGRDLVRHGVCWLPVHLTKEPSTRDLIRVVGDLTSIYRRPGHLRRWHQRLEQLAETARHTIDGQDKKAHPRPCPYCGRMSLVVYLTIGVIRCERDPTTGQYEPCVCPDSYCGCHTPTGAWHEWYRATKAHKSDSWQGLNRAQNAATKNTQPIEGAP